MTDTTSDIIWIVTGEAPETTPDGVGAKGGNSNTGGFGADILKTIPSPKIIGDAFPVKAQDLEQNMTHFLQLVGGLFNRAEKQANHNPGLQLEEIELSVEISGEGEVKLIGNGAKAGGKGAIKLTFRRQEPK
ncbi:hypothetical protein ACN23B_16220 [Anabaena sp. FACHB-709]|uniref:Pepco domain-containing protein n=2 Tax=Nostocaceae TaxID=1162 RepID=A0A1Z4KIV0_ANAVA|nr:MULTISPECIES: hypothetical protein [Nostocaceae]BAY68854.1 hypothetical protein NIES23_16440 [Trichormus variabilis NIES-23]HBW31541.1 hypothetical protein [Nostoc sp. UBA8866]MBD2170432.1 hypothetical protein [Anabaena cylindrica FACHB-318]MBD2262092.1 hypothetical protein [Anabaena sp. FACHB-709]MBD2271764.1 hypothetical protein [Nostoc sp. PCC 7120 = FACHB-418]